MTTIPSFSAKHWIDTNCRGGHALKREFVDVVSSFTLMWNIFEGAVCGNDAKIPVFKRRANNSGDSAFNSPCETVAARRTAIGATGLIREKCKRHAIIGKRSLNWSPLAEQTENNFSTKNGNPRYDCKNVDRAVPRRGDGPERRGDGTERKLRSAALNALTAFPRGQSARVPARPAGKPRRRRMFSACRPRAVRLQGRDRPAEAPLRRSHKSSSLRAAAGRPPFSAKRGRCRRRRRMGCGKQGAWPASSR